MFKELFVKKPRLSVREIAGTLFARFFKNEIRLTSLKIRIDVPDSSTLIKKEKLDLIIISFFVFVIDYSSLIVFGNTKTRTRILNTFYPLIKNEFNDYFDYIIEISQKFELLYINRNDDILFGFGMYFSKYVNRKSDTDILIAMIASTEAAKKIKLISKYFFQLTQDYRIT